MKHAYKFGLNVCLLNQHLNTLCNSGHDNCLKHFMDYIIGSDRQVLFCLIPCYTLFCEVLDCFINSLLCMDPRIIKTQIMRSDKYNIRCDAVDLSIEKLNKISQMNSVAFQ